MIVGICERVKKLKDEIQKNNFTIKDVILSNVSQDISEQDVFDEVVFDIVVKSDGEGIETEYEKCKEMSISFCRCIGGKIEKSLSKETVSKIYCMIGIAGMKMDDTFLQCMINEYYKVISAWTSLVVNAVETEDGFEICDILGSMGTDIVEFYDKIPQCFKKHMLEIYGIDINVIIGLSGSYYEGGQCNSGIFFATSDNVLNENTNAVLLKEPIEVSEPNIRKMRKLLEMGNADHYLVACKGRNNCWKIVGLYNKEDIHRGIVIRIIRHMVWYIEIEAKRAICYKCGKYVMECDEFSESEFIRKYENLFNKVCEGGLITVFRDAIKQEHGTIIAILENDGIHTELARLMKSSTGMEIKSKNLNAEYIRGITSIDGAVFFDELGTCYAIGVILDGDVSVEGKAERGARFNSALKYIKTCQAKGKKALIIVVSEDKTVDILSTAE